MFKNMLNQYRGALEIILKRIECLAREYMVLGLSFLPSSEHREGRKVCVPSPAAFLPLQAGGCGPSAQKAPAMLIHVSFQKTVQLGSSVSSAKHCL